MRDLEAACAELAEQLRVFTTADVTTDQAGAGLVMVDWLVAVPDVEAGTGRAGVPAPRLPGNQVVFNAEMDAHELLRRLEASLRLAVAGHTGRARGGSDGNTNEALKAIRNLGAALPAEVRDAKGKLIWPCQALAVRLIERITTLIGQLPAVDEVPKWSKIRPGPGGLPPRCPACQTFSLRIAKESGIIICVYPGADGTGCKDLDGRRPQARMDISKIDGRPVLVWRDGIVQ